MSKPWGGSIGSWAAEAERAEAEEREIATPTTTAFPSLKEAITAKPKKKKMTLSEFNTYSSAGAGTGSRSTRLTPDEMLHLPTGPKPRSNDEFYGGGGGPRLGGGFSNYGGEDRRGPRRGGFDDDRRGPRRGPDFEVQPSRADEVDNWASARRPIPQPDSRYTSLGGGSRADEVDNWASARRPIPQPDSRYISLGGGGSRADEVDNWTFGKKSAPPPARSNTFGSGFRDSGSDWRSNREGGEMGQMGRPRLVLDPPVVVVKTDKPNPFGTARPREEVLAEKGLDWKKLDLDIEVKKAISSGSRPTSSQGSRPTSSQSNRSENVGGLGWRGAGSEVVVNPNPRPKVNPFGDAKPREVLLEEKGLDWKKIDFELEHRRTDRPETEEEKALKEEIENLRKELEKEYGKDVSKGSGEEQTSLCDLIQIKEKDLEALIRELDDKVRFGQKAVERPGSGAGRLATFPERPPSQSGSIDGSRGAESMDRPRSRGTGDVWTRPGEDRRGGFQGGGFQRGGFQGGRDRGFLSNRDFDRSRSRERW